MKQKLYCLTTDAKIMEIVNLPKVLESLNTKELLETMISLQEKALTINQAINDLVEKKYLYREGSPKAEDKKFAGIKEFTDILKKQLIQFNKTNESKVKPWVVKNSNVVV